MKFNPQSQLFKAITEISQFIILNFCYLLCCLPIITIGVATSSLFEVCLHYADDERGYLIKDFFMALKNNLKKGTAAFLLFLAPIFLLAYSGIFWISHHAWLTTLIGIMVLFLSLYLVISMLYSFALIGRFKTNLLQTIKNALLLPATEPLRSFFLLLLPITFTCLVLLFPPLKFTLVLFGFSFCAYCSSFLFLTIFKRHA